MLVPRSKLFKVTITQTDLIPTSSKLNLKIPKYIKLTNLKKASKSNINQSNKFKIHTVLKLLIACGLGWFNCLSSIF